MTDRHAGYIVVLKENVREDEALHIITALAMIKRVASVEAIDSSPEFVIAERRADDRWRKAVYDLFAKGPDES